MDIFDNAIMNSDNAICANIDKADVLGDTLLAQNILAQLRNFVEAIIRKVYSTDHPSDLGHDSLKQAIKFIKANEKYVFLRQFHRKLEVTDAHLTVESDAALRLMWRYYDDLIECRKFVKEAFGLQVLHNLEKFPRQEDATLKEYYEKIADKINLQPTFAIKESPTDRFRILSKKSFWVNGVKYFELTLLEADEKASKFDRIIAFTKLDIPAFYSVHLKFVSSGITIINREMPLKIVVGFMVSIRPCEFDNYFILMGHKTKVKTRDAEYMALMRYLSASKRNLTDLMEFDEEDFYALRDKICGDIKTVGIFEGLSKCREYYNKPGYNTLVYLLYRLNNTVLKDQFSSFASDKLSFLFLSNKCIPFDTMPFAANLHNHRTNLADVFDCISVVGREHELLGRVIKNNTELQAKLYTPIDELGKFHNIDALIQTYNSKLYSRHYEKSHLVNEHDHVYIAGYEQDSIKIIEELTQLSANGVPDYDSKISTWLADTDYIIDDKSKIDILQTLFAKSAVAMIYGSAGTGKSTMIKHISTCFKNERKIYLTQTHAAVENLKRTIGKDNKKTFSTINKYLGDASDHTCDILFVDECSTVGNEDMVEILKKSSFKALVLVGDIYQIESIEYGNWFYIANTALREKAIYDLSYVHRSARRELLSTWEAVRKLDERMYDIMELNHFSSNMNDSIFEKMADDEIVLCLNYDGLYGINNLNKFIQGNNSGKRVLLGLDEYKVGDQVIFKETKRFGNYLYNNLKGVIVGITDGETSVHFSIEVNTNFDDVPGVENLFDIEPPLHAEKTVVGFDVQRFKNSDDDAKKDNHIVPFQIAYAVSIHKAQGLEYDSVKIIITDSVEELISHNIFYTAITRARQHLRIYWTQHTEETVLSSMHYIANKEDAAILMQKIKQRINH